MKSHDTHYFKLFDMPLIFKADIVSQLLYNLVCLTILSLLIDRTKHKSIGFNFLNFKTELTFKI